MCQKGDRWATYFTGTSYGAKYGSHWFLFVYLSFSQKKKIVNYCKIFVKNPFKAEANSSDAFARQKEVLPLVEIQTRRLVSRHDHIAKRTVQVVYEID